MEVKSANYIEICRRLRTHPLRTAEFPIGHAISLPLPTLRWEKPAYAFFANPARRIKGSPVELGPPDRWAAVSARGGQVLIYALCSVQPFTAVDFGKVTLPAVHGTMAELRQATQDVQALIDTLSPFFLAGEPAGAESRMALLDGLKAVVPAPLLPQYEALVPDFFAWLAA